MLVIPRDFPFEPGQLLQGMFCMVTAGSLETDVHVRLLPHHHPYQFGLSDLAQAIPSLSFVP